MWSFVTVVHLDLAVNCRPTHHLFGVAFANALEWLTGDHMKVPWLGVHRGRCAFGQVDNFFNQFAWHGLSQVSANAATFVHDVVVIHCTILGIKTLCLVIRHDFMIGSIVYT